MNPNYFYFKFSVKGWIRTIDLEANKPQYSYQLSYFNIWSRNAVTLGEYFNWAPIKIIIDSYQHLLDMLRHIIAQEYIFNLAFIKVDSIFTNQSPPWMKCPELSFQNCTSFKNFEKYINLPPKLEGFKWTYLSMYFKKFL